MPNIKISRGGGRHEAVHASLCCWAPLSQRSQPIPSNRTWPRHRHSTPAALRPSSICARRSRHRARPAAAPRWPAGAAQQPAGTSRSIPLGARADESIRQPVLRRRARILVVGAHDIGWDHHHRSDLRLFGRRAGRRGIEEARARSRRRSNTSSSATPTAITRGARGISRSGSAPASC